MPSFVRPKSVHHFYASVHGLNIAIRFGFAKFQELTGNYSVAVYLNAPILIKNRSICI